MESPLSSLPTRLREAASTSIAAATVSGLPEALKAAVDQDAALLTEAANALSRLVGEQDPGTDPVWPQVAKEAADSLATLVTALGDLLDEEDMRTQGEHWIRHSPEARTTAQNWLLHVYAIACNQLEIDNPLLGIAQWD